MMRMAAKFLGVCVLLVAGAMVDRGGLVVEAVARNFRSLVMPGLRDVTEVRKSQLGRQARGLGAAALVYDAMMASYPEPPRREYAPVGGELGADSAGNGS